MNFQPDDNEQKIIDALMSRQTKVKINQIEIVLKPLKKDTYKNREREAQQRAKQIIKLL